MSYALTRQQLERRVAVAGQVGGDGLQPQAVADRLGEEGLVLDHQHAHAGDASECTYRRRIEKRIRGGNAARPWLLACPRSPRRARSALVTTRPGRSSCSTGVAACDARAGALPVARVDDRGRTDRTGRATTRPARRGPARRLRPRPAPTRLADGVVLHVNSGWRSTTHQQRLFDEAVAQLRVGGGGGALGRPARHLGARVRRRRRRRPGGRSGVAGRARRGLTACAASTTTSPGTSSCAPTPSAPAARRRTPTRPPTRGCSERQPSNSRSSASTDVTSSRSAITFSPDRPSRLSMTCTCGSTQG